MAQQKLAEKGPSWRGSSPQQLASLIKSIRDIMRKDKGLSGELDRIPMMTWIMFLKFLDDQEKVRESEAELKGIVFRLTIEPPYRWRDWAANEDGITGQELLAFVNQDEAVRPDGSRGLGLFAYLRALGGSEGRDRRDVVATVFKGTVNRMINGYLLRDVINKIDEIHFDTAGEMHSLAFLYESLLKEMRDAAGDSGEFYTPRPVIKFMVQVINPTLGETILDPAAGTGGFLVECFNHLGPQCKKAEDFERLQEQTLYGYEAKPMPYLLCQMNMLLHGIEAPEIDPNNALRFPLREIGDRDRVDIILTNPPFGGEEEKGILGNFPEDKQTTETALLFLQLIMRRLKRLPKFSRCAVVVPDGTLFGDGVCARIKEDLLREFNLHTIVRLPAGVFAPYTDITTNLLFFDRPGPTQQIWYYEQPLPEGRKKYTKTKALRFEEFEPCIEWWKNRKENDRAWRVSVGSLLKRDQSRNLLTLDLDIKNPKTNHMVDDRPPADLLDEILKMETLVGEKISKVRLIVKEGKTEINSTFPSVPIGKVVTRVERSENPIPGTQYRQVGVKLWGGGVYEREPIDGSETKYKSLSRIEADDIVVNKIWARNGSVAVVPGNLAGCYVSTEFPTFAPLRQKLEPRWFHWLTKTRDFWRRCDVKSRGTSGKNRIRPEKFLEIEIPLPTLDEQRRIVQLIDEIASIKSLQDDSQTTFESLVRSVLDRAFRGQL